MNITGNFYKYNMNIGNFSDKQQYRNSCQIQVLNCKNQIRKDTENNGLTNVLNKNGYGITFTSSALQRVQLKNKVLDIFKRSIAFGPNEYKNLSEAELNTVREFVPFFKEANKNNLKCIEFIIEFGKLFSKRIHEKYPDGFIFVAIGRSPAFLGKMLEFEGEDVRYCPISHLSGRQDIDFSPDFLKKYKEFLDKIGLTKELAETTEKPIIILDYNHSGTSLWNFRRLLAMPEIGIKESNNVRFSPITRCGYFNEENSIFYYDTFINSPKENAADFPREQYLKIMDNSMAQKDFTSIPYI